MNSQTDPVLEQNIINASLIKLNRMKKWIKYIIVAAAALFVVRSMMPQGT